MRALREVLIVYAGVALATTGIIQIGSQLGLAAYTGPVVGLILLLVALRRADNDPRGPAHYGLRLGDLWTRPAESSPESPNETERTDTEELGLLRTLLRAAPSAMRETLLAIAIAALVFPPYAYGFYLFHGPDRPFVPSLPENLASFVMTHLLVVALPEEAFFRGYVQTRLCDVNEGRSGLRRWIMPIVMQSILFALLHLAGGLNPGRLAVFAPGLLFGALRAWRGGIGAAVVLHALSNLCGDLLARSWP